MAKKEAKESWRAVFARDCAAAGFYVREYSPGDGKTRYRFFTKREGVPEGTYFGPENGDYTALGRTEAEAYAAGRWQGYHHGKEAKR